MRGETGAAAVTPKQLLQAALRLRPDRLLLGEMRGAEAFSFLRAVNTGHPGSLSTIHANRCAVAIEKAALLALQARVNLGRAEIVAYARSVIDIVVQLRRDAGSARVVGKIELLSGSCAPHRRFALPRAGRDAKDLHPSVALVITFTKRKRVGHGQGLGAASRH